jgi:hypothetical protein
MEVPEVKRLKSLEEENARLKKLLAEAMLEYCGFSGGFQVADDSIAEIPSSLAMARILIPACAGLNFHTNLKSDHKLPCIQRSRLTPGSIFNRWGGSVLHRW